jgi:hypothetical protein
MNDSTTATGTLDQTDEDILSYTVSDEALEAAAGTERGVKFPTRHTAPLPPLACCGVGPRGEPS